MYKRWLEAEIYFEKNLFFEGTSSYSLGKACDTTYDSTHV